MEAALTSDSGRRPGFTPAQVMAAGLLLVVVAAAVWVVREPAPRVAEEVELLAGTDLGPAELAVIEAVFDRAELADYRVDEGRVYVNRGRQSGYLRALVDAGALPPEFGGSLRRAVESDSPWRSKATQAELLRIATQEELSLVIRTMPGIEQAAVLYDLDAGGSIFREDRDAIETASVSVRTEVGTPLDPHRVQAIRVLVASSIAGLRADRVAVTDLRSGQVFDGPLVSDADLVAGDPERARAIAYERHVVAKIRQALAFISGVVVEVNASAIESAPQASEASPQRLVTGPRAAANAPASVGGQGRAGPQQAASSRVVQVSVAIPETYFARLRDEVPAAPDVTDPTAAELARLQRLVAGLVPAAAPWGRAEVTITRYPGRREGVARHAAPRSVPPQAGGEQAPAGQAGGGPVSEPVQAALSLPVLGLPSERLLVVAGSAGLGLLGLLTWLWGRRPAPLMVPSTSSSRDAIDWPTLSRPAARQSRREAT